MPPSFITVANLLEFALWVLFSLWSAIERNAANENDYNYEETFTEINFVYCLVRLIISHFTLVQKGKPCLQFSFEMLNKNHGWMKPTEWKKEQSDCLLSQSSATRHLCENKVSKIFSLKEFILIFCWLRNEDFCSKFFNVLH